MSGGDRELERWNIRMAPLARERPRIDTSVTLPSGEGGRPLVFGKPFFIRTLTTSQLGAAWSPLCELMRRHEIPVFGAADQFEDVPAASVPSRLARRWCDEPFDAMELRTADAFLLECRPRDSFLWGWPGEISDLALPAAVAAVRTAASDTPIGFSLPLGCNPVDLERAIAAGCDYVCLDALGEHLEVADLEALRDSRQVADHHRPGLPLLVTVPTSDAEHLIKLLAMGATSVALDTFLLPHIPSVASAPPDGARGGGMLSGITIPPAKKSLTLPSVEQALTHVMQLLQLRLHLAAATQMSHLSRTLAKVGGSTGDE